MSKYKQEIYMLNSSKSVTNAALDLYENHNLA
jgi:hypothetical protein